MFNYRCLLIVTGFFLASPAAGFAQTVPDAECRALLQARNFTEAEACIRRTCGHVGMCTFNLGVALQGRAMAATDHREQAQLVDQALAAFMSYSTGDFPGAATARAASQTILATRVSELTALQARLRSELTSIATVPPTPPSANGPIATRPVTVPTTPHPRTTRSTPSLSSLDRIGPWLTLGLGGIALTTGVISSVYASNARDEFARSNPYSSSAYNAWQSDQLMAEVAFGAGAALAIGGVTWLLLRHPQEEPPPIRLTISPFGGIGLSGAF